jgi:hypothetical protein
MRARPELVEIIIEKKILRWCRIARWPETDPCCTATRARKNYWKLCAKYPHIMERLGLSELSVYE